ncbi:MULTISPECIES: YqaA family protein [Sphingomonadaceae]|uniref:Inner membrane protein YqaA n=2 Tax=Novosphingobium subterraneum TaxID=48936 RepID=A0A0B8ZPX3_9SPHN|nr:MULTISPECIES: YqaA family protein [Sphingomonadaceae]KHS45166.1 Inner membrane protein YqaA [Novosphingobium subterraneum]RSU87402.1 DedA family protein [Sphingomonas koreensis]CAH0498886.1 Inner membrane protein YqaA [Novosphingobium sp. CECT 9465]
MNSAVGSSASCVLPESFQLPDIDLLALGYPGLFLAALVAATLLPAQSELLLLAMLASGRFEPVPLLLAASVGNVLGSTLNWALGRFLAHHRGARWFPVSETAMAKAERRYRRFGALSLLFSWLPIIGDPLTLIAGVLRTPLSRFLLLVTIAKSGRYLVLMVAHGYLTA